MKLIDNWNTAHRMFSVQCMTAATALIGAWETIPADLKSALPSQYVHYAAVALGVLGVLGRLVKQDIVSGNTQ